MRKIALCLAAFGFVAFAAPSLVRAEEKTEKTETKTDAATGKTTKKHTKKKKDASGETKTEETKKTE